MSSVEPSRSEVARLHQTIEQLRQCIGTLRSQFGDTAGRRLDNDVQRLEIDAVELTGRPGQGDTVPERERMRISDAPYDPNLWVDADDRCRR